MRFYWFEVPKSFSELKGLYSKRSLGNTSLSCLTFTLLVFTVAQLGTSSDCHYHQTLYCHHLLHLYNMKSLLFITITAHILNEYGDNSLHDAVLSPLFFL